MWVQAAPGSIRIQVLKRPLVEVPAVGGIDPTAISLAVRGADEQLSVGREHAPGFIAEPDQSKCKVLNEVLGDNRIRSIVRPRPRKLIQIVNNVDPVQPTQVNVRVPSEAFQPGTKVEFHGSSGRSVRGVEK